MKLLSLAESHNMFVSVQLTHFSMNYSHSWWGSSKPIIMKETEERAWNNCLNYNIWLTACALKPVEGVISVVYNIYECICFLSLVIVIKNTIIDDK